MATAKLTLSIDADTIEWAKKYVSEKHISLSKFIQNQLNDIAKREAKKDPFLEKFKDLEISPDIIALTGILKGKYPDDVDYREAYREHLSKKHGL
jgi:hypothetical protein